MQSVQDIIVSNLSDRSGLCKVEENGRHVGRCGFLRHAKQENDEDPRSNNVEDDGACDAIVRAVGADTWHHEGFGD